LLYGQLFLFVSALTYSTQLKLAIVAIYSLRFVHSHVAKDDEACRNSIDSRVYFAALTNFSISVAGRRVLLLDGTVSPASQ
jgi:hypothetical protein